MSASAADIEKLTESDKAELVRFVNNETQRSKIQAQVHALTATCWKKCVPTIKGNTLDRGEETCLANCVDRFLDIGFLTTKHLNSMRQQQ